MLLYLLKHENGLVRGNAAAALGEIGKQPETVIPAMIALLKKEKPKGTEDPREPLMWGLRHFGSHAKPAIPALLDLIADKHENASRRKQACEVLQAIGPHAKEAVPILLKLMQAQDHAPVHLYISLALEAIQQQPN